MRTNTDPPAAADQEATRKRAGYELPPANAVLAPLAGARSVALAVSGGGDSMALLALFVRWRRTDPAAPPAIVLTVDHGLRPGSADTCAVVAAAAARHGLPVRILKVPAPAPAAGVQGWARGERYRLLAAAAVEADADVLVTAHTRDDVAETFLMRLSRGSGLAGLSAMSGRIRLGEITLVRPLLGVPRDALRGFAAAEGFPFQDDPANADPRHERTRVRRLLRQLDDAGLDPSRLALAADRLAAADRVVDDAVATLAAAVTAVAPAGIVALCTDTPALAAARSEVRLRLLARILQFVGGRPYPARRPSVEALDEALLAGLRSTRTLAGCRLIPAHGTVFVVREARRSLPAPVPLGLGTPFLWDGRFVVRVSGEAGRAPPILAAAGDGLGVREVDLLLSGLPDVAMRPGLRRRLASAAATAPAVRMAGRRIAVGRGPSVNANDHEVSIGFARSPAFDGAEGLILATDPVA